MGCRLSGLGAEPGGGLLRSAAVGSGPETASQHGVGSARCLFDGGKDWGTEYGADEAEQTAAA
jgi:hypothetical protein